MSSINVNLSFDEFEVLDGYETCVDVEFEVEYTYHKAVRAYTPPGEYAPIDPPEPAFLEIDSVRVVSYEMDGVSYSPLRDGSWPPIQMGFVNQLIDKADFYDGSQDEKIWEDMQAAEEAAYEEYCESRAYRRGDDF